MYKIKVKKIPRGYKTVLYKKWFFIWLEQEAYITKIGYEYMVDEHINQWVKHFNIPENLVEITFEIN